MKRFHLFSFGNEPDISAPELLIATAISLAGRGAECYEVAARRLSKACKKIVISPLGKAASGIFCRMMFA